MLKSFFAPEEATLHLKQIEREKLRALREAKDDGDDKEADKYYPLAPQQWRSEFLSLRDLHVIKNPRILQTLFFLLRYNREEVCERDTAKLDCKKARMLINDKLFQAIGTYNPYGPSNAEYKKY